MTVVEGESLLAHNHSGVFVDADHIEESGDKTMHIAKLHMAALGLAHRHPVKDAARC